MTHDNGAHGHEVEPRRGVRRLASATLEPSKMEHLAKSAVDSILRRIAGGGFAPFRCVESVVKLSFAGDTRSCVEVP
jgi:hypothetical protein